MSEREQIVAWLRNLAETRRTWTVDWKLHLRVLRLALLRPHGLASAAINDAAAAIERGEHLKEPTP